MGAERGGGEKGDGAAVLERGACLAGLAFMLKEICEGGWPLDFIRTKIYDE